MKRKLNILGINGSASTNSSNLAILKSIKKYGEQVFEFEIMDDLAQLPHFRTELTNQVPEAVKSFYDKIEASDGVIICTPEYVFSIPSGLKNAIEWCVSTTVFSDKPVSLITASASGEKGHEELKLIMKTIQTHFNDDTTLLIQGVKGKIDPTNGTIKDLDTRHQLENLIQGFCKLL